MIESQILEDMHRKTDYNLRLLREAVRLRSFQGPGEKQLELPIMKDLK